uniref:CSON011350 protein n=1 Tax=Culicoides sonorensis TaxID=179676 RepID=A0A336N4H0_CULSO
MKFIVMALLVCIMALAIVSAVPVEETFGDVYAAESYNPEDPQQFLKLKKLKKLFLEKNVTKHGRESSNFQENVPLNDVLFYYDAGAITCPREEDATYKENNDLNNQ